MTTLQPKTGTDWIVLIAGILGAIKLLAAAPPFNYEIPQETIDALVNLIAAGAAGYAAWRNNKKPVEKAPDQDYTVNKYNKWE